MGTLVTQRPIKIVASGSGAKPPAAVALASPTSLSQRNPLDVLAQEHKFQAEVCNGLERIADGLPDEVDRRLCQRIISCLRYDLPLHHRDEEEGLFPLLRARAAAEDSIGEVLDHLERDHKTDEGFSEEVLESLEALARGDKLANPEMVGYMLRGFFEGYRRHIHWEETLVLPFARQILTPEDCAKLAACMSQNRLGEQPCSKK
ncbi:MAG: hemerythrin domain-containing protein [Hyphomicrobiales bacterium]